MKKVFKILLTLLTASNFLFAKEKENLVAKAILLKGNVQALGVDKKIIQLKQGSWVEEGAIIKTSDKSFVKLLFIDKSQMNLGAKSEMEIKTFPKKEAGIINLLKGQLRSKVTKNYMEIEEKNKSKLYIKTKTAAMGVRGTDFQVNYNPANSNTSLITFEGAVSMGRIAEDMRSISQNALEKIVSSSSSVLVTRGQYSGTSPQMKEPIKPVKLSPAQFNTLKNTGLNTSASPSKKNDGKKTTFRSPIPPGVDAQNFSNKEQEKNLEKEVGKVLGAQNVNMIKKEAIQEIQQNPEKWAQFVNKSSGEELTPGGLFDANTVQYIPPPKEISTYDPITETYIPPPEYGTFDQETGEYVNEFYQLESDGNFVKIEGAEQEGSLLREPASLEADGTLKEDEISTTLDPNFTDGTMSPDGGFLDPTMENQLLDDTRLTRETTLQTTKEGTIQTVSPKVDVIIDFKKREPMP